MTDDQIAEARFIVTHKHDTEAKRTLVEHGFDAAVALLRPMLCRDCDTVSAEKDAEIERLKFDLVQIRGACTRILDSLCTLLEQPAADGSTVLGVCAEHTP